MTAAEGGDDDDEEEEAEAVVCPSPGRVPNRDDDDYKGRGVDIETHGTPEARREVRKIGEACV